jgi:hypothetical protein
LLQVLYADEVILKDCVELGPWVSGVEFKECHVPVSEGSDVPSTADHFVRLQHVHQATIAGSIDRYDWFVETSVSEALQRSGKEIVYAGWNGGNCVLPSTSDVRQVFCWSF